MPDRPRPHRAEPRDIGELRQLQIDQPQLAVAAEMQNALVALQRRVQARVALPWIEFDPDWVKVQQAAGRPLLRFEEIPVDWSDFRLALRQSADILRRYDALEAEDHQRILALGRETDTLAPLVADWYRRTSGAGADEPESGDTAPAMLDQVLMLALRPFVARCADVVLPRVDLSGWTRGRCPLCGWEPELAVITHAGERLLICGRCTARWRFDPIACPFCGNDDRSQITSFATPDGRYRVGACDRCKRYIKAFDTRRTTRPVMPVVDTIATLPLDAAAVQKGYLG